MAVTDEEIIRRLRAFKGSGTNLSRTAANRIEKLRQALEDVVNPIGALRRMADAEGSRLNEAASYIANDPAHIRSIAQRALEQPQ